MNIYVGNLNYKLQESELEEVFSEYGEVSSVKLIKDKYTGKAKGFGFVEMPDDEAANKAIEELDGKELSGRQMKVNKARSKN
ncbi:MAG: RNA recognition motif domain-containing protein [Bacteroidota bacterium]